MKEYDHTMRVYPVDVAMNARLESTFTYHAPRADQLPRYEELRLLAKEFAHAVMMMTPPSREQSLALTEIENAVMHANAAIARNE